MCFYSMFADGWTDGYVSVDVFMYKDNLCGTEHTASGMFLSAM